MMLVWGAGFNGFKQISDSDSDITVPTEINLVSGFKQLLISWSKLVLIDDQGNIFSTSAEQGKEIFQDEKSIEKRHQNSKCLACMDDNIIALSDSGNLQMVYDLSQNGDIKCTEINTELITKNIQKICGLDKELLLLEGTKKIHKCKMEHQGKEDWTLSPINTVLCSIPVETISCGKEHVLILGENKQIYTYGGGSRGQLGHGTVKDICEPLLVEALAGVAFSMVAAGGWHSVALSDIGDVWVWGWNESGQLGLPCNKVTMDNAGHNSNNVQIDIKKLSSLPADPDLCEKLNQRKDVLELTDQSYTEEISQPASSTNNQSAVDLINQETVELANQPSLNYSTTNTVDKMEGNLYIQSCDSSSIEVQSDPCGLDLQDTIITAISCGTRHTALLSDTGILLTCGWNKYGQLCHGDTANRDYLQTVDYFVRQNLQVINVYCGNWNTVIVTNCTKT